MTAFTGTLGATAISAFFASRARAGLMETSMITFPFGVWTRTVLARSYPIAAHTCSEIFSTLGAPTTSVQYFASSPAALTGTASPPPPHPEKTMADDISAAIIPIPCFII